LCQGLGNQGCSGILWERSRALRKDDRLLWLHGMNVTLNGVDSCGSGRGHWSEHILEDDARPGEEPDDGS
jgi:hypothetical protein